MLRNLAVTTLLLSTSAAAVAVGPMSTAASSGRPAGPSVVPGNGAANPPSVPNINPSGPASHSIPVKPPPPGATTPASMPTISLSGIPSLHPTRPGPPISTATSGSHSSNAANSSSSNPRMRFNCDTTLDSASEHFKSTIDALHEHSKAVAAASRLGKRETDIHLSPRALAGRALHARAAVNITVDTYVHIVETHAHAGTTTLAQVASQLGALNAAYAPYGVAFMLRGTTATVDDTWAVGATPALDLAMKTALRTGPYAALNIYLQSDLANGVLGKCTLPADVGPPPGPAASAIALDGCNVAAGSVPGGALAGYNLGKTAVHEVGHWLGLLHTFEGYSCGGAGDYVADTPAESVSTDGCPVNPWKNSCAGVRAGVDPIHNYMDYSDDACYTRFTDGQQARIMALWPQFRRGR